MPQTKAHRSAGLRAHSRSSSTGSSRVGLNNLQFTQREPAQPAQQQKGKKPAHGITEVHSPRAHSPVLRGGHLNGHHPPFPKDHLNTVQPKRPQTPTRKRPLGGKTDFAIARSDDTDDEDEWVSSESTPVTPARHSDDEEALVIKQPSKSSIITLSNEHVEGATPRAEYHISSHVEPTVIEEIQPSSSVKYTANTLMLEKPSVSPIRQIRSEAPSPTHNRFSNKRHSLHHDSSIHHEQLPEMRRHPLIRGQSYQGPLKPPPLAPLAVNSEVVSGQISASPSHIRSGRSPPSPTSLLSPTSMRSPVLSQYAPSTRRTSISSSQSVATVPALSSNAKSTVNKGSWDRLRTMSSASSAALSSLTALPASSRPSTPPLVTYFPPDFPPHSSRPPHPLLPQELLQNHLSILNSRNLLRESYDRVLRSKGAR